MTRLVDLFFALTISGPVRSVVIGGALLWAVGHHVSWWLVALVLAGALADTVWCATKLPARMRPW